MARFLVICLVFKSKVNFGFFRFLKIFSMGSIEFSVGVGIFVLGGYGYMVRFILCFYIVS